MSFHTFLLSITFVRTQPNTTPHSRSTTWFLQYMQCIDLTPSHRVTIMFQLNPWYFNWNVNLSISAIFIPLNINQTALQLNYNNFIYCRENIYQKTRHLLILFPCYDFLYTFVRPFHFAFRILLLICIDIWMAAHSSADIRNNHPREISKNCSLIEGK